MAASLDPDKLGIPDVAANAGSVSSILNVTYFIAGAIAVLVMVIAGFMFVTSNGSPERIKVARTMILSAVIGLVVVLMAAAITAFVIKEAT